MQDLFGEPADVDGFCPLSWVYRIGFTFYLHAFAKIAVPALQEYIPD
jgi:hypothetical protein